MNDLENNLKFEYLYRDAGNYKQFGSAVFKNPTLIEPDVATEKIKPCLIDGEFFYPDKVKVPRLENYEFDPEMDHDWYEFEKFSLTNEKPTEVISAQNFLDCFARGIEAAQNIVDRPTRREV
ncbi:hypothetical protein [Reichenbachiella sp. MALMAid0571]|uniref:hypothetical protein n=1 Tax=Reichenbachiella sp. MALMAid0571 TaxID=3143939 RepID=UPI0032DE3FED